MQAKAVSLKLYIAKRIVQIIPLIFVVIIMNFVIIHLAPGDPAIILAGEFEVTPEYLEKMRVEMGLDKPLYEQLAIYIWRVLHGNLGYSFYYREPVLDVIMSRVSATILLMGLSLFFAAVFGIILGVFSSSRPYSFTDNTISVASLVSYSMPIFWLAQMLLLVFAIRLDLFPAGGIIDLRQTLRGLDYVASVLYHAILPGIALALYQLAIIYRLTRATMLEVLREDYITTARSKGLSERVVLFRHALKNALLPVITVIGIRIGFLLSGAVMSETVFSWPGIGRLMFDSIRVRDYPVLMGIFTFVSIGVAFSTLLTDITYSIFDPRVRYR